MRERIGSRTRALLEGILVALIFIILLGSSTLLVYEKSLETLDEEIKIGLLSVVQSAATALDGDLHRTFTAATPASDAAYLAEAGLLEDMRRASQDVRYAYTNILVDGHIYFVVNISPQNDVDGDGMPDAPPSLMAPYDEGFAPELLMALTEHQAYVTEEYEDQWGTFISAYAPFYDSRGEFVGTLGMDLELDQFFQRLEKIEVVFEKARITILFLGLVIGLLVWSLRRSHQDDALNLQLLTQANARSDAWFRLYLAQVSQLTERLSAAWRSEQLSQDQYFAQLAITSRCGGDVGAAEAADVDFDFAQWHRNLQQQTGVPATLAAHADVVLPTEASGQPVLLTDFFTQLLHALQTLAGTEISVTHTCLDERPRHWQMQTTIDFAGRQVPQAAERVLIGNDLAGLFGPAGPLSAEELLLVELLRLRNLLAVFDASISREPNSLCVTWALAKRDAEAE